MTYDEDKDTFTLSSGRTFFANTGIVGLRVRSVVVFGGYDNVVYAEEWTRADREELADTMIKLWQDWKNHS